MASQKKKIAVLMGGPSSEHEVSLKSGENVVKNINPEKYEARKVFISKKGEWEIPPENLKNQADVAFIALHGTYGEDGTIQSILDQVQIPYTGSNAAASALAMNKFLSLRLFRDAGLTTPMSLFVSKHDWHKNPFKIFNWVDHYAGYPLVVKPNDNGSSVGVYIPKNRGEFIGALENIFGISRGALLQNFVQGREMTCGVLDYGPAETAFPLLPTEIIPQVSDFFDYRAKYEPGGSLEITPPPKLTDYLMRALQKAAVQAHRLVGARGFSRTDFIVDKKGDIYILEINTIPGLTEQSLIPKAAQVSGIPFGDLIDIVIQSASKI